LKKGIWPRGEEILNLYRKNGGVGCKSRRSLGGLPARQNYGGDGGGGEGLQGVDLSGFRLEDRCKVVKVLG